MVSRSGTVPIQDLAFLSSIYAYISIPSDRTDKFIMSLGIHKPLFGEAFQASSERLRPGLEGRNQASSGILNVFEAFEFSRPIQRGRGRGWKIETII